MIRGYTPFRSADDQPLNDPSEEEMDCPPNRNRRGCHIILLLLIAASSAHAQADSMLSEQSTFVFIQKTSGVAKFSSHQLFQHVVDDLQEYLKAHEITTVVRTGDLSSEAEMPLYAVQEMARNSHAMYLLYVIVDRPTTKWLKVTVACYDAKGQQVWAEESSAGKELLRHNGEQNALKRLHQKLDQRLGRPGLLRATFPSQQSPPADTPVAKPVSEPQPVPTSVAANPAVTPEIHDESPQTIRLASGTPVHLFLAETLSSKTAQTGATVKLQVLGDVKVGDLVVIANKAPAVGRIEAAQNAGRGWRAGRLVLKLQTVMLVNQNQQQLEAWNASKGAGTGAAAEWTNAVLQSYGLALFALPFAPLQHGNQALLYKGTQLEAVTTGDALLPRGDIEAAQPKPAEPRSGPAIVTFYYPNFGHGSSMDIWCGQLKVGHLSRGGKFSLSLPPARYWLRFARSTRAVMTPLDAESGTENYVSVVVVREPSTQLEINWQPHLSVVPHDIGEAQSADTATAKSQHELTADKFDLAQLQADPRKKNK